MALITTLLTTTGCEPDGAKNGFMGDSLAPWNADQEARSRLPLAERYAAALDEQDPLLRHMWLAEVYSEVDANDLPALLEVLKKDLRIRRPEEVRTFANLLARLGPDTALSEVLGWGVPAARMFAQAEVMSIWVAAGKFDLARSTWRKMAAQLPVEAVQYGDLGMVEALARHRVLPPILELMEEADEADHRRRMLAKASLVMSQTPGISYSEWAEQLFREGGLGPELTVEVQLQAIKILLLEGPEPAIDYYERVKEASFSGDALAVIGEKWAYTDPKAALEFMRSRPPSEKPDMGKRAVAIIWLQQDPATGAPFLHEAIDKDPDLHAIILPVVQFQMVSDLPGAMKLAQRIPVEEERTIALKQGLMRWVQRDPAAVERYMSSNPVSDEIQQAVRGAKRLRQSHVGSGT